MLASHFLERAAQTHQKAIKGFAPEAVAALCRYGWPGHIRELRHVVERAALLCSGNRVRLEHLAEIGAQPPPRHFGVTMREEKRRRVMRALAQTGGNQAAAARLLGMSRSNLARLMKTLDMKTADSTVQ